MVNNFYKWVQTFNAHTEVGSKSMETEVVILKKIRCLNKVCTAKQLI